MLENVLSKSLASLMISQNKRRKSVKVSFFRIETYWRQTEARTIIPEGFWKITFSEKYLQ